jgi:hypothetical protein
VENERFDDLIKRLETTRVTRGAALRGLLGGGAAVLLGTTLSRDGADARRKHQHRVTRKAVAVNGSGVGFVGKGDVQLAFGWNNAVLQQNASGVSFTYEATEEYDVTIEYDTGNPDNPRSINHHTVTQGKSTGVSASVAYDKRVRSQITGFNLTGFFGDPIVTGDPLPSVGDSCPNGNIGTCFVTAVDKISSSGGLYVHYGSSSVPLPNTPVVV